MDYCLILYINVRQFNLVCFLLSYFLKIVLIIIHVFNIVHLFINVILNVMIGDFLYTHSAYDCNTNFPYNFHYSV